MEEKRGVILKGWSGWGRVHNISKGFGIGFLIREGLSYHVF